jgi:hypothetical protein
LNLKRFRETIKKNWCVSHSMRGDKLRRRWF